ncbi:hypothetical protein GFD17_01740 [Bifidobacterium sp. SMB2]|uniref:Uncharacterized protein n=1 Tax=Bifidobacterium saimiriisciurei TaxID=2661627 RepID=A0ABX0CCS2_9BIFI|nr:MULTISPECIES: hypothetical protein [Bifidobacterium]NEG95492.1 hypothetical protein [Bifidobacterium sp. SMB2]NEH11650.1 hypothetical protein [Bifidobacterium saimiriisciurei]
MSTDSSPHPFNDFDRANSAADNARPDINAARSNVPDSDLDGIDSNTDNVASFPAPSWQDAIKLTQTDLSQPITTGQSSQQPYPQPQQYPQPQLHMGPPPTGQPIATQPPAGQATFPPQPAVVQPQSQLATAQPPLWQPTVWTGTDQPRADAEKDSKGEELHMAWFYTKFALFCWVFAIGGLYFQLEQYDGRIALDTIMPALLFGIPAIITTVVAGASFYRWYGLRRTRNPYQGLIGVVGKDIAAAVGGKSLKMPNYDQDGDPAHDKIRRVLFEPTANATVRFPVFIPVELWRRCAEIAERNATGGSTGNNTDSNLTGLDKALSDHLDQMEAAGKISPSFRKHLDQKTDGERRHTAYIVLHVANGQASIVGIDPLRTFEQRAEFDEKGASKCVTGGRYDGYAKAIIIGRQADDHDYLMASR